MNQQVLIIGAGPCGLTAAAFLNHYGISCRLIDKRSGPTQTSNAIGMQPRTIELFEELSLHEIFLQHGLHCQQADFYNNKKLLGCLPFYNLQNTKYPFINCIPQNTTEKILIDYLHSQGIDIEYNTNLKEITTTAQSVTVKYQNHDQLITSNHPWLIATDGGHSTVRQQLGIPYQRYNYPFQLIMIDCIIDKNSGFKQHMAIASACDYTLFAFPMQHATRLIAEVSQKNLYQCQPNADIFKKLMQPLLPFDIDIHDVLWQTSFQVHESLISTYQHQRVFFSGDAAHTHIPAAAQGMNTGMQDCINICWKLARVIKNHSSQHLLNTYQKERRPIARDVLKMTDRMGRLMMSRSAWRQYIMRLTVPWLLGCKKFTLNMANTITQLSIHYHKSKLSQGIRWYGYRPGDRIATLPTPIIHDALLVIDTKHNVPESWISRYHIQLIQPTDDEMAHIIQQSQNSKSMFRSKSSFQSYLVIRPDRYIGFIGNTLSKLENYLKLYSVEDTT